MEKPERADRADRVKSEKNIKISLPEKERISSKWRKITNSMYFAAIKTLI